MQLIVLAHAFDGGAQAVANILAPVLGHSLIVLRPEWLGQAHWSQRVSERGISRTLLHWRGGHSLDGTKIGLVWNRIRLLPQAAFRKSSAQDRDYAGAELQALVASWLAELGERVDPPMRRHGFVTPVLHHLQWAAVAGRSGFALAAAPSTPEDFWYYARRWNSAGPLRNPGQLRLRTHVTQLPGNLDSPCCLWAFAARRPRRFCAALRHIHLCHRQVKCMRSHAGFCTAPT